MVGLSKGTTCKLQLLLLFTTNNRIHFLIGLGLTAEAKLHLNNMLMDAQMLW